MNYEKFKSNQIKNILEHNCRGLYSEDNRKHSNENIDSDRTHLNYELHNVNDDMTVYERYKARIDDIASKTKERTGRGIRKDAVTCCSWVITATKDLQESEYDDFFKSSYDFLCKRYGKNNVVSAVVHCDEITPHLHFTFIPVQTDKQGNEKLCAKDLETRTSLKKIHTELQKYLNDEKNISCSLLNGATVNGNKSIQQLKLEKLKSEVTTIESEIKKLNTEKNDIVFEKGNAFIRLAEKVSSTHKVTTSEIDKINNMSAVIDEYNKQIEMLRQAETNAREKERKAQQLIDEEEKTIDEKARNIITTRELTAIHQAKRAEQERDKVIEERDEYVAEIIKTLQEENADLRKMFEDITKINADEYLEIFRNQKEIERKLNSDKNIRKQKHNYGR